MLKLFLSVFALSPILVFGQTDLSETTKPIVAEGKLLYQLEMASWNGTDLFLENYQDRQNIGGYFSYEDNAIFKCIFFSSRQTIKIIGTISFDSTFDKSSATIDLVERGLTDFEKDLYDIRSNAMTVVHSDSLFKRYKNTSLNLIPFIAGNDRKVFILTGPEKSGVVIIGNDYLLTFDNSNNLTSKKRLHKNIIPFYFSENTDNQVESGMHNHSEETGDFITSTDICTLMLYSKFAKWKTHHVLSSNYLNIWNCETNELVVLPKSALDKIYQNK